MRKIFSETRLMTWSMAGFFTHLRPEDNIPELARYSEPKFLTSEVMLIMIPLQSMKISAFIFWSINMMKTIVCEVIHKVPNQEPCPEHSGNLITLKNNHLTHSKIPKKSSDSSKDRRINNAITRVRRNTYGSTGSIWWMPCIIKCR